MIFTLKYITDSDMNNTSKYCREHLFSVFSETILPFLGAFTLLNILPAFLYGCSSPEQLQTYPVRSRITIGLTGNEGRISDLDIFVFRDDGLQRLDCYQKVQNLSSWNKEIVSGCGDRLIAVCANSRRDIMEWAHITSLTSLQSIKVSLEDESSGYPFMCGIEKVVSGYGGRYTDMKISPISSIVQIRSISCDFSDKPYSGAKMTDAKAYLTNVNAECGIFEGNDILPTRIINAGGLCIEEMKEMKDASLLYGEFSEDIGRNAINPGLSFRCYPNNSASESPGTPFTRLVIEGKILGETYYWPIDINRDDRCTGIYRNEKYIYDIRITRKGSSNPDIPVKAEDIDIMFKVEKWKEQEDYEIIF